MKPGVTIQMICFAFFFLYLLKWLPYVYILSLQYRLLQQTHAINTGFSLSVKQVSKLSVSL